MMGVNGIIQLAMAASDVGIPGAGPDATEGINALILGLILIIGVPILIYIVVKLIRMIGTVRDKGLLEEMRKEATRKEKAGELVSAAVIYERLQNTEKAAELYEGGGDFIRAASTYESLGRTGKAGEMYEKAGDLQEAAESYMIAAQYHKAARIYSQTGDKVKTAKALEMTGNRRAAARAYREAEDYTKASELLEEEGMHREAADMYGISLANEVPRESNAERFYVFALLLEKAGDSRGASSVYRQILRVAPDYRDVKERLSPLDGIHPGGNGENNREAGRSGQEEGYARKLTPLKSVIKTARMEPRYSFRLWVQVLKAVQNRHSRETVPESLSPEGVLIDGANNVIFDGSGQKDLAYTAPEVLAGRPPDEASMIYSLGVILYEMLTGSLDDFGTRRPGEVNGTVPPWLDGLTMKCVSKDRSARFAKFSDIFLELRALKNKT